MLDVSPCQKLISSGKLMVIARAFGLGTLDQNPTIFVRLIILGAPIFAK